MAEQLEQAHAGARDEGVREVAPPSYYSERRSAMPPAATGSCRWLDASASGRAGLGFFGGIGFFAYSIITLSSAVTRVRMERATRMGQARLAAQARAARGTLDAQLQQIDQARAAGLIQEAEYQAKRAEIIARF